MSDPSEPGRTPRRLLAVLLPPLAAWRYGATANNCTAPITTIWLAAVIAIAYAFLEGAGRSIGLFAFLLVLGVLLWAATSVWTILLLRSVHSDPSLTDPREHRRVVEQRMDEHNPLDEADHDPNR